MKLLIPVAAGLEQTVKRQLFSLGYEKTPAENGRLEVEGDFSDIAKLNLWLRSGERVLIKLAQFHSSTFDELYEGVYSVRWEDYLCVDSRILMDGKSFKSKLGAIKAIGGVAKKAVISRLAEKVREGRKTFSETGARSIIGVSLFQDVATITLDTTGESLHKRGYRSLAYSAPLKETLAAALVDNTFFNPDRDSEKPFADLFCGSGTLPIEAALKALHIPPGLRRDFDFTHWKCTPVGVLTRAKEQAMDEIKKGICLNIYGGDINPKAITIAKYHAKQAGVSEHIRFSVADARKFTSTERFGILLSNPPYGERLSEEGEVRALMRDLGNAFRALPDWNAYLFTSLPEFERYFGKRADKKKKFMNANLPCGFYAYFGKSPREAEHEKQ